MTLHRLLAEVIRPIVEGQIKAWQDAHPEGERYPGHLISGVGKRITHDICSAATVERIKLALEAGCGGGAVMQGTAASEATTEQPMGAGVLVTAPGGRRGIHSLSGFPS
jgi:hypothetical protein